jgi:hypothetical protein
MKLKWKHVLVALLTTTAFADDIDAEIVKHLDFFEQMPVVEDLQMIELEAGGERPKTTGAPAHAGPSGTASSQPEANAKAKAKEGEGS